VYRAYYFCPILTCCRRSFHNKISQKCVEWEPSCTVQTDERAYRHDEANSSLCTTLHMSLKWNTTSQLWRKLRITSFKRSVV